MQTGVLTNAVPNVSVQVEDASVPVVILPTPFDPLEVAEVPQALTVSSTVPVDTIGNLNVANPFMVLEPTFKVPVDDTFPGNETVLLLVPIVSPPAE